MEGGGVMPAASVRSICMGFDTVWSPHIITFK